MSWSQHSKKTLKLFTYSHGSFKRASQDVVHRQLRVVAPQLCGTHALGWWDEETVFCSSSSTSRNVLMVGRKTL